MEIFEALEGILTILSECINEKAFAKDISLSKRLPYILIYTLFFTIIIIGLFYLGIIFIKRNAIVAAIFCFIFFVLCIIMMVGPFVKK